MSDQPDSTPASAPDSTPEVDPSEVPAEGMGVSSERTGPAGPGQTGTDGTRDTSPVPAPDDAPPEASAGGAEENPEGLEPKAGYPERDPRS